MPWKTGSQENMFMVNFKLKANHKEYKNALIVSFQYGCWY